MAAITSGQPGSETAAGGASGALSYTVTEPDNVESSGPEPHREDADGEQVRWDERLILELPPDAEKEEVSIL